MARKKKPLDENENITDRIVSEWRYNLTFEQQKVVETRFPVIKDLLKLTQEVYGDETLDKHSKQFENIKAYHAKVSRNGVQYNFKPNEIEFIRNNAHVMRPVEMIRQLFPDNKADLTSLSKSAASLVKALGLDYEGTDGFSESLNASEPYIPPFNDHKVIALINRADSNAGFASQTLDSFKKDCIASLKRDLQSQRFVAVMNSIRRKDLRTMMELEFIATTYDKPDLSPDDRNLYITQCYDYVLSTQIQEQIALLNDRLMEANGDDENGRKMTMTLVEALGNARKEYNDCQARISKNAKSLSGDRAKRNEMRLQESQSLVRFIKLVKDEDSRKRLVLAAKAKEEELKKEITRIADFDSIFAEAHGISQEEIIRGL